MHAWIVWCVGVVCLVCASLVSADLEQAASSEAFADSVCLNTKFAQTNLPAWVAANKTALMYMLLDAGIYNVRDTPFHGNQLGCTWNQDGILGRRSELGFR